MFFNHLVIVKNFTTQCLGNLLILIRRDSGLNLTVLMTGNAGIAISRNTKATQ